MWKRHHDTRCRPRIPPQPRGGEVPFIRQAAASQPWRTRQGAKDTMSVSETHRLGAELELVARSSLHTLLEHLGGAVYALRNWSRAVYTLYGLNLLRRSIASTRLSPVTPQSLTHCHQRCGLSGTVAPIAALTWDFRPDFALMLFHCRPHATPLQNSHASGCGSRSLCMRPTHRRWGALLRNKRGHAELSRNSRTALIAGTISVAVVDGKAGRECQS